MRPRFALWSDYGYPARTYRSATARGARPSIGRNIFLAAIVVIAAVIGISELHGHAVDKKGLPDASGAHPQNLSPPSANATGRRYASVAAIPLSPQPAFPMNQAMADVPASVPAAPDPSPHATPAAAAGVSGDHEMPPDLTAIPGALTKTNAPPSPPAARPALKSALTLTGAGPRKLASFARHPHGDTHRFAGYAEAIAKLSQSRELRAALRLFL
jgi:hypothetical protein